MSLAKANGPTVALAAAWWRAHAHMSRGCTPAQPDHNSRGSRHHVDTHTVLCPHLQSACDQLHRSHDNAVHNPGHCASAHDLRELQWPRHRTVVRTKLKQVPRLHAKTGTLSTPLRGAARAVGTRPTWLYVANTIALVSDTATRELAMPANNRCANITGASPPCSQRRTREASGTSTVWARTLADAARAFLAQCLPHAI